MNVQTPMAGKAKKSPTGTTPRMPRMRLTHPNHFGSTALFSMAMPADIAITPKAIEPRIAGKSFWRYSSASGRWKEFRWSGESPQSGQSATSDAARHCEQDASCKGESAPQTINVSTLEPATEVTEPDETEHDSRRD